MHTQSDTHTHTHSTAPQTVFEVGTDIAKDFNGELYHGCIVGVDEDADSGGILYSVQYEDGDGEDLNEAECKMAVEYRNKIESGEIKEWEIGRE